MNHLTELQKEFINLLAVRFEVNLAQIDLEYETVPKFESLFEVEAKLADIKEEYGFRDTLDIPEEDFKEGMPL